MKDGFKILDNNDINSSIIDYLNKGALRGKYLGFPVLNEFYTMALGSSTDWTGSGGSGKSEFLLELLLNTSKFYGWKHLLYVPDVGDKNEVIAILIHKLTGNTFDKRYRNLITEKEVYDNLPWILEHFKILSKENLRAKITPYEFWDIAAKMNIETKGGIQTATIDSWKDMKHGVGPDGETFARDDKYLDDVLSYRNAMSELHKMHFHIIIHPLKTEKDKNGNRLPATPYDLKGGTAWFDNGKTMVTVHRVDGTTNEVEIIINKAKPKSVAKNGIVRMYFNVEKARFYYDDAGRDCYSSQENILPIGLQISNSEKEENDDIPF